MSVAINGTDGITYNDGSLQPSAPVGINLIINGNMAIDQRNAGASVTITSNAQYTIDRFQGQMSQASKYSVEQVTDAPAKFYNSLKVTSASAYTVLATDFFAIEQRVEGYNAARLNWGTSDAQTVTLSFWVKSSLTGTFTASLRNGTADRSFPFTYTIGSANTWEYKTVTIAGDTSGTWDKTNGKSIRINFPLGMGTNFTSGTDSGSTGVWQAGNYAGVNGAVNVVATSGATWQITGLQLETGTTATDFENLQYGTQLALCQRYYYKWNTTSSNNWVAWAMAANTTNMYGHVPFPTTMRSNPGSIEYSGLGWWVGGAVTAFSAVAIAESGTGSCTMNFTSTGLTAQKMYAVLPNGSTNYIAFVSEL